MNRPVSPLQLLLLHTRFMAVLLTLLGMSACNVMSASQLPTPYPTEYLPTVIALTVQAIYPSTTVASAAYEPRPALSPLSPEQTPSPSPTIASTATTSPTETIPAATTRPPTATRTFTPTPELPIANIQIFRPGPASKVISPLKVSAYLVPGARGSVRMELLGEDGRLLVRKILSYSTNPDARVFLNTELDFEIEAVAETGRLVISTEDSHGRTIALASVDLLLLSIGEDDINPSGDQLETIVIREPAKNLLIQGGVVVVSGLMRHQGNEPLLVELISADGKSVGPTRLIAVENNPDGSYAPFSVEVPYSVNTPTWVRVMVSERDYRIAGIIHLSSVEVLLSR